MSRESCSTVRVQGEEVNSRINEVAGGYSRSARLETQRSPSSPSSFAVSEHNTNFKKKKKKPPQRHDVIFCSGWPQQ